MILERPGGFPAFLRDCIDHVMSVALLRENYFWSVYLNGSYSRESCPRYLQEESFARLKAGLVENVRTFTGTVTECLAREARAHHRLRASRPHGLAGPERRACSRRNGPGSSAWPGRARA